MADEHVSLNLIAGTERVLALNELSQGFRRRFYVHVAGTRKLLLIESSPPLRTLDCIDSYDKDLSLDIKQAPWVIATHSRNLFALWDPTRTFEISFLDCKAYMNVLKTAFGSKLPEVVLSAQHLALSLVKVIDYSLQHDEDIVHEFEEYKQQVDDGERNLQEDMRMAAIDGIVVFTNEKGQPDVKKDKHMKLQKAFCAWLARRAAEQKAFQNNAKTMDQRAALRCVIGFAEYKKKSNVK